MKTIRIAVAVVATALGASAVIAQTNTKGAVTKAGDAMTWEDFSPQRPGVKMAKVSGDHTTGAWKAFVKYPPNTKAQLHTHDADLELVVISGAFRFGDGTGPEKSYGPGSYLFIPAGTPHTNSTAEDTLMFESQPARFATKPVTPAAK